MQLFIQTAPKTAPEQITKQKQVGAITRPTCVFYGGAYGVRTHDLMAASKLPE